MLDDRDYAIGVRNRVFPRFGLPGIHSVEAYYEQFTFPVRLYYEQAGVTEENFTTVADAWMAEYLRGCGEISLRQGAVLALNTLAGAGLTQVVLSASQVDILGNQLDQYGLRKFFGDILGLGHIYASSKAAIGKAYLEGRGIPADQCVLLGDSLHDAQVAREMGIDGILISGGHQSLATLRQAGLPVCNTLEEAAGRVLAGPGCLES